MKLFNNLLILASIIYISDIRQNNIYLDSYNNDLSVNYIPIEIYKLNNIKINYKLENRIIECDIINKYNNSNIITKENIKFLNCRNYSYFAFIKCNKNINRCKLQISPFINYKCFPKNLCNNMDMFKKFNTIITYI